MEEGSCNTCGAAGSVTCVVVEELDVSVLLSCDGDWQRGMTQHFVDLAGSVCVEADVRRTTLTFKTNNLRLSGLRAAADEESFRIFMFYVSHGPIDRLARCCRASLMNKNY